MKTNNLPRVSKILFVCFLDYVTSVVGILYLEVLMVFPIQNHTTFCAKTSFALRNISMLLLMFQTRVWTNKQNVSCWMVRFAVTSSTRKRWLDVLYGQTTTFDFNVHIVKLSLTYFSSFAQNYILTECMLHYYTLGFLTEM